MKANELMIGDYVYFNCFDGSKIIVKVTGFKDNIVYGVSEYGTHWCQISKVEPIPLTAEILEKNGIKWLCTEPSGRKTYCCNEPVVQCTYIPDSGWLINAGVGGRIKVHFVEISKVQYVHELQHALRLCDIEKEIIL